MLWPFTGAVMVAAVGLLGFAGVVLLLLAATRMLDFDLDGSRRRLDPIPIPESACPFVEVIHDEATRFQQAYLTALFDLGPSDASGPQQVQGPPTASWLLKKQELDDATVRLDFAVAIGAQAFPPRITRRLTLVREALGDGRALLATATNPQRLIVRTDSVFRDGQEQFGYASDLVGDQCGVPLRADSYELPSPSLTPAATATGPS